MNRLFYLALIVTCLSCSKSNADSNKLPAGIQALIKSSPSSCVCDPYIDLYIWNSQQIYMHGAKGPGCNWMPLYFNSKGEQIDMEQGYTLDNFKADAEFVKNVWTCTGEGR